MLKKEQEKTLAGLARLSAKAPMTARIYESMWAVVLLTVIVTVFGVHAVMYLDKSLKCEQMLLLKTKMGLTASGSPDSYDSVGLNPEKNFKDTCSIPYYGMLAPEVKDNEDD